MILQLTVEYKTIKKGEVKLIVYQDGDKEKDRPAKILEVDELGIKIQLWDIDNNKALDAPAFLLPWHKVSKVKELGK